MAALSMCVNVHKQSFCRTSSVPSQFFLNPLSKLQCIRGPGESINPVRLRAFSLNWRWGIGAHLGLAFAAVVALAIAANLLIEHEISVVRTTRIVTVEASALPAPGDAGARLASVSPPPIIETASAKSLVAALEHFVDAVRNRMDIHNANSDGELAAAAQELDREAQLYTSAALPDTTDSREKLLSRFAAFRAQKDELVRAADGRRNVLKEFWDRFDALDARTKASLAGSWKIFGRVVARKTLVDLNSSLDEIRREFAGLPASGLYDHDVLVPMTTSETALALSLATNEAALTRSQGETWVKQSRADVADLEALQGRLILMDAKRHEAEVRLAKMSQSLITSVTAAAPPGTAADVRRAGTGAQDKRDIGDAARKSRAVPLLEIRSSPVAPTERTTRSNEKPRGFGLIFWLSAAVVAILLWISIRTVTSVVGPVRRIRAATLKIAGGETGARVKRGGIRELDDLAISFNLMAEQLADAKATARSYQEQLEARVKLRTRELRHLADHDPLTLLPNRRQLFAHLKAAVARAAAGAAYVGVFFVDLDNFKNINDSLGHAFGDRMLSAIAARLLATTNAAGFAARLGGDEFTVVYGGLKNAQAVNSLGQDLVRAFQAPIAVDGRHLMISISVGASMYPDHGSDAEELLRAADAALFRAKALGRSQLVVFSPALLEAASAKFTIEQGLRYALERNEFELVFQPEVDAATLNTHVVEALLRWRLPDGRCAPPGEFLAIAEESGLILEINDWVVRTAIETAAQWHHGAWPEARVAINLSSRQLLDARFVDRVTGLLREHRLPARCIEIELTENVLQTGAATIAALHQLRSHGVSIALDDFGIGYSSLASLEQLPLTRVKLDRALIASVHTSSRSAAIARSLVGLCHDIGLEVTAEGIECREQLALLSELAPIYLQGFLVARPVPVEQILPLMQLLPDHLASLLLTSSGKPIGRGKRTSDIAGPLGPRNLTTGIGRST
jgi:diguanylate cyclase (GGDEF)-like protein